MQRVLVIGSPGSGKSVFSRELQAHPALNVFWFRTRTEAAAFLSRYDERRDD